MSYPCDLGMNSVAYVHGVITPASPSLPLSPPSSPLTFSPLPDLYRPSFLHLLPRPLPCAPSTSCPDPSPVPLPPPYLRRYARKHFSSTGNEHLLKEIQTAMGLLAFSPTTKCKRYQVHSHSMSPVNPVEGCPLSGVPL